MECIFCKIASGEIPAHKIYENDRVLVFLDIQPGCQGHSLVIPKAHARDLLALAEADLAAVMAAARRVAPALVAVTGAEGLNLHQSNGEAAGQVVPHFHLHLLPRRWGDELRSPWQSKAADSKALSALAAELAAALKT